MSKIESSQIQVPLEPPLVEYAMPYRAGFRQSNAGVAAGEMAVRVVVGTLLPGGSEGVLLIDPVSHQNVSREGVQELLTDAIVVVVEADAYKL